MMGGGQVMKKVHQSYLGVVTSHHPSSRLSPPSCRLSNVFSVFTVVASTSGTKPVGGQRWYMSGVASYYEAQFHCYAPIPLLGSPWQQSNDGGAKRSTGGECVTQSRRCQSYFLCALLRTLFLSTKGEEQIIWPTLNTHWVVRRRCDTFSMLLLCTIQLFLRTIASPLFLTSWEAGKMNGDNSTQIFHGDNGNRMFHFQRYSD